MKAKDLKFEKVEAEIIEAEPVAIVPAVVLSVSVTPGEVIENFNDFKAAALAKVEPYKDVDLSTLSVSEAKQARAYLNAEAKRINDERLHWERIYNEPFNAYKTKAKELIDIFKVEADRLGSLIKEAEEWGRQDRQQLFEKYYTDTYGLLAEVVPFERILDDKWLNKTYKADPTKEIDEIANKTADSWASLKGLNLANYEQAEVVFFRTLDLGAAIAENDRLEADKARIAEMKRQMQEQAEQAAIETPQPVVEHKPAPVVNIPAPVAQSTPEQATALETFQIEVVCPVDTAREACQVLSGMGYEVKLRRIK